MRNSPRFRIRVGWRSLPPVLAYAAFACLLGLTSMAAVERLAGSIISQLPVTQATNSLSRVEQWSAVSPHAPVKSKEVHWAAKQAIPPSVVQRSERTDAKSSDEPGAAPNITVAALELSPPGSAPAVTYRTVCVRLCDGAYFPVSFTTTPEHFARDEATCQNRCRQPAKLFAYPNPGGRPADMVDINGVPYSSLPTSFRFQTAYDPSCTCDGNPWDAKSVDRHRNYEIATAIEIENEPALANAMALTPTLAVGKLAAYAAAVFAASKTLPHVSVLSPAALADPPPSIRPVGAATFEMLAAVEPALLAPSAAIAEVAVTVIPSKSTARPARTSNRVRGKRRVIARTKPVQKVRWASAYVPDRYVPRTPGEIVRWELMAR